MRVVGADTETFLLCPGVAAPKLVCGSYDDDDFEIGVELADDFMERFRGWLLDPTVVMLFHNAPFDLGVLCAEAYEQGDGPAVLSAVFDAIRERRIRDTLIREKILENAKGELKHDWDEELEQFRRASFSLERVSYTRLKEFVNKGADTWRKRYGLLAKTPITEWPEDAIKYALKDATLCRRIFVAQEEAARADDCPIHADGLADIPGETATTLTAFCLGLMRIWGVRTDPDATKIVRAEFQVKYDAAVKQATSHGLVRNGKRKMEPIRNRVQKLYTERGADVPLSPSGKNISTDRETLTFKKYPGWEKDEALSSVADVVRYQKLLTTYVPILERGGRVPITPNWNAMVETFRTSCSDPNCFDGQTELLTTDGWVCFDALMGLDVEVAQWNNGVITFVDNWKYVETTAEMFLYFQNQHIDLAVTSDHRCLLRHRRTGELRVMPASEYKDDWQQIHAGQYDGGSFALSQDQITLLCATQADGSWHDGGIDFSFQKPRKIVRLRAALDALQMEHRVSLRPSGATRIRVQKSSTGWLYELLGPNKRFGSWVLRFTRETLDAFCLEVYLWDGCATRMNHYSSNDPLNTQWVQIAHVLSGQRANVRVYQGTKNINYQVDVTHRDYSLTTNVERGELPGGKAYCVTVPSSFVVVRRSGKVMVTGNCQNLPRGTAVRNCFVPREGYVYVESDYSTLEMRTFAQVCITLFGYSVVADAFKENKDTHLLMTANTLDISYEDALARYERGDKLIENARQYSKIASYGFLGGMGPDAFIDYARGYDIIVARDHASKLRDDFKRTFTEVNDYFAYCSTLCGDGGESEVVVHPITGYVRGRVRYTALANHGFQHLAAVGAKAALCRAVEESYTVESSPLFGCRPVNFSHDSIMMEVPKRIGTERMSAAADHLSRVMIEEMSVLCPDVPIKTDTVMMSRWRKGTKPIRLNGLLVPSRPEKQGDRTVWVPDLEDAKERAA